MLRRYRDHIHVLKRRGIIKRIAGVTTRHVLDAAKAHVRPDELQIVVVGNPDVIREPIEAFGFGPLTVREASEE